MVASVTEGEDKPLKYPLMFRACELVVLNKIDLLPHVDFDVEKWAARLETVHPGVRAMLVSARTGEGVDAFRDWLGRAAGAPPGGGVTQERTRANREFFAAESARLAALCDEMALRFLRGGRLLARRRGVRRAPHRGRVRPPGDRRQAGAARAGAADDARRSSSSREPRRHRGDLQRRAACGCDDRVVRPADGRPVRPPGADRDALPRALGARARVPRAPRPLARSGAGAAQLPLSVPRRAATPDLDAVREDVRRSIEAKAEEIGALREQTLRENARRAAAPPRRRCGPAAARAGQRRLGDRRDGHRRRPAGARAARAGPDRRPGGADRDRQRHRRRGDLLAPGDRPRAAGRHAADACRRRGRRRT